MTLDNHAVDAMVGEQRGGRESVQAATDNEDSSAGAHDDFLWNDKVFAIRRQEREGSLRQREVDR